MASVLLSACTVYVDQVQRSAAPASVAQHLAIFPQESPGLKLVLERVYSYCDTGCLGFRLRASYVDSIRKKAIWSARFELPGNYQQDPSFDDTAQAFVRSLADRLEAEKLIR